MTTHIHPPLSGEKGERFLEYVHQVSPEADTCSVMLFFQVLRANNLLTQAAEHNLAESGLTWAKFRLLMHLQRSEHRGIEGIQPSELSEMQGISRNTASALIASLEEEGLISRELHGSDRRRFIIRLTSEGRKVLKGKLDGQFQFFTRCFSDLSSTDRKTLLDLLAQVNQTMSEKAE